MSDDLYPIPDYRQYVKSGSTDAERACRLGEIITRYENVMLESADTQNISEYRLDDGQTKLQAIYRSGSQIMETIKKLQFMKEYYENKNIPRTTVLRNHESIRRYK